MRAWVFQDFRQKKKLGEKAPWSAGWVDPEGKRRSKRIGSKSMAEKYARKKEGELAAGLCQSEPQRVTWQTEIDMDQCDTSILDGVESAIWFVNGFYKVLVCHFIDKTARLTIIDENKRHNWRDYQRIKDELLGIEWEGVELYPAGSRLVDRINAYHIWCRPTAFPIGGDNMATYSANGACFTPALPMDAIRTAVATFGNEEIVCA
jgi:hypothetical protein